MNLKAAHLVAIQFGILVGVAACLLFFRFESPKPRTTAEMRELATELVAAVKDVRADMVDERAEAEPDQLAPGQLAPAVPNQYSPEAVEHYRALATKLYYEQIAPRRKASSSFTHSSTAAVAPSYTEVAQEPAVVQTYDPAPQTTAYVEPTQVIVYPQPVQYVGFSHRRRFVNRCRPTSHHGGLASNPDRRPDRRGTLLSFSPGFSPASSLGVVHRPKTDVASCPSPQEFKPRGRR